MAGALLRRLLLLVVVPSAAAAAVRVHPHQVQVHGLRDGAVPGNVLLLYPVAGEGRRGARRRGVGGGVDAGLADAHDLAVLPHVHGRLDHELAVEAGGVQVGRVQLGPHELRHEASRGRNVTDVWDGVEELAGRALRRGQGVGRGEGARRRRQGLG